MTGYEIAFYTLQNREYQHQPIAEWLVTQALDLKISGATVIHGAESYGRDGRVHAARFFEQAEQPVIVVMVVSEENARKLFELVKLHDLRIFYTKTPVEYGIVS
ncbi:MAG: DUF190 domain-containing protein [Fluviibacter sp.]